MDARAAKLALARKKLKDHQVKKTFVSTKDYYDETEENDDIDTAKLAKLSDTVEHVHTALDYKHISIIESTESIIKNESPKENCEINKKNNNIIEYSNTPSGVNVTELLISNERNLENQINELQTKLAKMENSQVVAVNENLVNKQKVNKLQQDLQNLQQIYAKAIEEINSKEAIIAELDKIKFTLKDENNILMEQLEVTKTMLTAKESENVSLQSQLQSLQSQLDVTLLQLQQISNGNQINVTQSNSDVKHNPEILSQKITTLEHQLKTVGKERDQINMHYEQYVAELNEELKSLATKNERLTNELNVLSSREASLIEQISDMEIRLQNFKVIKNEPVEEQMRINVELKHLQLNYNSLLAKYEELCHEHDKLQKKYAESEDRIEELNQTLLETSEGSECNRDNISISKLNADIASDKLAAQRATEQNKKLKIDLQELEEAFVKISRDKLELTEKVAAEKYLNRELTIKLAEIEEQSKDMHTKLIAKDEEMIRLQTSYRQFDKNHEQLLQNKPQVTTTENLNTMHNSETMSVSVPEENTGAINAFINNNENAYCCLLKHNQENVLKIPKEDAMTKLQHRFLKIMKEVADLSDEKHRLEHIILQLQNETDTICEYVALYQQQRSLLKKKDEERCAQIKKFQMECQQLKNQLEELSGIIIRLAKDTELVAYFQSDPRQSDLAKVMNLLTNLRSSSLIDPDRTTSELKGFYPCNCCSGQLIEV